jgi:hypothetical protein
MKSVRNLVTATVAAAMVLVASLARGSEADVDIGKAG